MVRGLLLGALLTMVLLVLAAWAAIANGLVPIAADASAPAVERWAAHTALIAGVMRREHHGKNPVSGAAAIVDGIHLYQTNCEICHGDAQGTPTTLARGLYQPPPQFAKDGAEDLPYAYSSWVIAHGIRFTGMPSFSKSLSVRQIAEVALFLQRMDHLTPEEAFAWQGAPLRSPLASLYRTIGGSRACVYFPRGGVKPHIFRQETYVTHDGAFVVEHYYNHGISEVAVLAADRSGGRFVRIKISKRGDAEVATSPGPVGGIWAWTATAVSDDGATTSIKPQPDGSYTFLTTNGGGFGKCDPKEDSLNVRRNDHDPD